MRPITKGLRVCVLDGYETTWQRKDLITDFKHLLKEAGCEVSTDQLFDSYVDRYQYLKMRMTHADVVVVFCDGATWLPIALAGQAMQMLKPLFWCSETRFLPQTNGLIDAARHAGIPTKRCLAERAQEVFTDFELFAGSYKVGALAA